MHTYRPRMRKRPDGEFRGRDWLKWRNSAPCPDSTFNPLVFCACAMVDVGLAMRDGASKFADPAGRDRMKRELMRDLRRLRRPFYYERETERRRRLAAERRRVSRRATSAPMPTPEEVLAAWNARKESREAMVRLGGMLHDLECYVDNCLRFDESGGVAGRNGGIKGWLGERLPELLPKYKDADALQGDGGEAQAGDGHEGPEADLRPSRGDAAPPRRREDTGRPGARVLASLRGARAHPLAGGRVPRPGEAPAAAKGQSAPLCRPREDGPCKAVNRWQRARHNSPGVSVAQRRANGVRNRDSPKAMG